MGLGIKAFYLSVKVHYMIDLQSARAIYSSYLKTRGISTKPQGLYSPINYIMNLGGKHIRATFLLLAYGLFQNEISDTAKQSAYAIELFHNFSLVHDDIMDEANTRRGKPSVHSHYGVNSGILSGDAMLILVYEELLKIQDENKRFKILTLFTQTAKEVCEGQQYDIDFETSDDVTIEDYLLMIKLKTAVLLACSLQIGAILGGASDEDAQKLYDFGINIGISFQVQDDLLDTYGEQVRVGKMIGGDIQQKKKTILYLTTLQHAKAVSSDFKELYNSDLDIEEKLPQVRAMMDSCQIQEKMNALKKQYLDKALESLGGVNTQNKIGLVELEELANYIVNRVK